MTDVTVEKLTSYAGITDEACAALNAFENAMLAEKFPDDPPRAIAQTTGPWACDESQLTDSGLGCGGGADRRLRLGD